MAYLVSEQSGVQKINGAAYPGIWVEKQVVFVKMVFNTDISSLPAASLFELGTTTPVSAGTVADSSFGVVESVLVQALEQLETDATILAISNFAQITPTVVATEPTTGASSTTVIPMTTTGAFAPGQTVAVTVGVGSFAPGTKVVSVQAGVSITVSAPPTFPLASGATVTGSTFAGSQVDVMLGYATSFFGLVTLVGGLPTATGAIANANTATPLVALTSPPVDSYTQALIFAPGSAAADAAGTLVTVNPAAAGISWLFEFAYMDGLMDVATSANGALQYITDGVGQGTAQNPMGQPGFYPYDPYTA
jgi:hypothetical protein